MHIPPGINAFKSSGQDCPQSTNFWGSHYTRRLLALAREYKKLLRDSYAISTWTVSAYCPTPPDHADYAGSQCSLRQQSGLYGTALRPQRHDRVETTRPSISATSAPPVRIRRANGRSNTTLRKGTGRSTTHGPARGARQAPAQRPVAAPILHRPLFHRPIPAGNQIK